MPSATRRMIVCRTAERIRFEPAAAEPGLELAVAQNDRRRHHRRHPPPGGHDVEAERVQVLLAQHVVDVHPRARHEHAGAGAVRAGDAAQPPLGVHRRDVGGRAEPVAGALVGPIGRASPERTRCAPPSSRASERNSPREPVLVEPVEEALGAGRLRLLHRRDHGAKSADADPLEQVEGEGDQDPAGGRRRIGEHLAAAEARPHRVARDRLVGGHVVGPSVPPRSITQSADRCRDLPP